MSVWRMEIDMSFATEDEMKSMLNLIEKMRDKLQKQDGQLEIPCRVRTHECMHPEGQPCGNYTTVEFDGVTDHGIPAEVIVPEEVKTVIKADLQAEKDALEIENAELKVKPIEPTGPTGGTK